MKKIRKKMFGGGGGALEKKYEKLTNICFTWDYTTDFIIWGYGNFDARFSNQSVKGHLYSNNVRCLGDERKKLESLGFSYFLAN